MWFNLRFQVQILSTLENEIALYLIYNISDDGYLDPEITMEYVAESFSTDEETVLKVR